MTNLKVLAAATFLSLASAAHSTVLLSDNFDTEAGGISVMGYNKFKNFTTSGGAVDLIKTGYAIVMYCLDHTGSCVDLDSGTLRSKTLFDLTPGNYQLSFYMSGNQRVTQNNTVIISLGNIFSQTLTLAKDAPYSLYSYNISVLSPTSGYLSFTTTTPTVYGAMLDSVTLATAPAPIPEPGSMALLALGLGGLASQRRRRRV